MVLLGRGIPNTAELVLAPVGSLVESSRGRGTRMHNIGRLLMQHTFLQELERMRGGIMDAIRTDRDPMFALEMAGEESSDSDD